MHTTSLPLIGRMRLDSDRESWVEFVDLYGPLLYRWNLSAGLQPADAQEIVQEVLLVVFQRLRQFERRHPGAFRAWLKSITAHKVRELRRRHAKRREEWSLESRDTIDAAVDSGSDFAWAERYAEDLFLRSCELARPLVAPATWAMFIAVYVERESVEAVASRFGVTRNAVYVAQCRCLAHVRSIVSRYLDDSMQAPIVDSTECVA